MQLMLYLFLEEREEEIPISYPQECRGGHGGLAAVRGRGEDGPLHQEGLGPCWPSWCWQTRHGQENCQA